MKRRKKSLALLLVFCCSIVLSVSGCSKSKQAEYTDIEMSTNLEGENALTKEQLGEIKEKLATYETKLVATIDDYKLYMDELLFYIVYYEAIGDYQDYYNATNYDATDFWETVDDTGNTMRENLKQYALDAAVFNVIYSSLARKEGYTLTEEEVKANEETVDTLLSGYSNEQIAHAGLARKALLKTYEALSLSTKYGTEIEAKILEGIDEEEIKKTLDLSKDEGTREYETDYLFIATTAYDENMKPKDLEKEELEKRYQIMEEAVQLIQDGKTLEEVGGELAKKADVKFSSRTFDPDNTQLEDTYVEAAIALANGEVSDIVESNYGYYIIEMIDNESQESYEKAVTEAIQEKIDEIYNEKYQEVLANVKITWNEEVLNSFQIGDFTLLYEDEVVTEEEGIVE